VYDYSAGLAEVSSAVRHDILGLCVRNCGMGEITEVRALPVVGDHWDRPRSSVSGTPHR